MSNITHSDELVTKTDLANFYQGIYPYLGGGIGVGGGYAPIGTIISYMGTTAPQDYLACDGTVYNIADYKQLADFFTVQFGSVNKFGGNGTTTFAVPDLRGEFLRGTGTNSHENQGNGANVGVHQDATEIPKIFVNGDNNMIGISNMPTSYLVMGNVDSNIKRNVTGKGKQAALSGDEWDSTSYNVATSRPTNTSILYCIKAVCAGEVYSTTERVVATWIDGKPLYQKTIVDTLPNKTGTSNAVKHVSIGASIDYGFVLTANFISTPNNANVIPFIAGGDVPSFVQCYIYPNNGTTQQNVLSLVNGNEGYNGKRCYVTIRYTKTTD